jgi:hypothetical protein
VHTQGTTSSVMVASRTKVRFWPDGSTSPENYGYQLVQCTSFWALILIYATEIAYFNFNWDQGTHRSAYHVPSCES